MVVRKSDSMPKRRFLIPAASMILFVLFAGLAALNANANGGLPGEPGKDPPTPKIYNGGHGVTAPVVIDSPQPASIHEAGGARIKGVVMLEVVIAADGTVNSAKVQMDPDKRLAEAAVDTVKKWKFKPATKDGRPVWCRLIVEITFHSK
jgi:TonB family protein